MAEELHKIVKWLKSCKYLTLEIACQVKCQRKKDHGTVACQQYINKKINNLA